MEKFTEIDHGYCTLVKINIERAGIEITNEFKKILLGLISEGKKKLILDLSGVSFMDSTFLGAIVLCLKRTAAIGGDLRLISCDCRESVVWTMFHSTRMDKVFMVFEDAESALHSFK